MVKNNRVYTSYLSDLKLQRSKGIVLLGIKKYIEILQNDNRSLSSIFKNKGHNDKKIAKTIAKSLTSLDMRLLEYPGYINSHLEIEEQSNMLTAIEIHANEHPAYIPLDIQKFIKPIINYSIAIFDIKKLVSICMFNSYGYNSIIYVPLPKSSPNDPFSFYSLESVSDSKRCWKMECRLEDISYDIANQLKTFCTFLFRKIYYDVFKDNEYREDFTSVGQITECDCQQLIKNIKTLSSLSRFRKNLQNMVIEKSIYTPTKIDKFNFYGDDSLQKKRLAKEDEADTFSSSVRALFDTITDEQLNDLCLKHQTT